MERTGGTRAAALAVAAGLLLTVAAVTLPAQAAASGCAVNYAVSSQWQGGFGAAVTVTNLGDPVTGWTLTWSYTAGQQITQAWNATVTQNGAQVTARNVSYNGSVATNGTVSFGFNGSSGATNPAPTGFALNGVACTGGTTPTTGPTTPPTSPPTSPPTGSLPSSFRWSSSDILMQPKPDGSHPEVAIKDPSVVYYGGRYHVFATQATGTGWGLEYRSFTDWSQAAAATPYFLDRTPIGGGYRAAPMVFYFAPQRLWYLIFQNGNAAYSTNPDIANPAGWSAPRNFFSAVPPIVEANKGNGSWLDFTMACDAANCYLYSADDNGHIYRSQTSMANFPNGMGNTVIMLSDANPYALFEAPQVYKIAGRSQYLLIVEAIGGSGRYFRSWTATSLNGSWTPLAASESNSFAGNSNVTFPSSAKWSQGVSHGELIRTGYDQNLELSPCNLRFLYQGLAPGAGGDYGRLPYKLGLLTQTNSTC
ncbi:non-reducing end alpha-L-arabinofuranosidase family hydrolase [Actinoplanes sp. NPDC049599]|uniref:non-reducing end alpha-L-arabinofuranosidase family hydrolase n=1 Tax=Actinoplanes sp. NPDC049599 TaxID=3363903 RepID=UPI00378FECE4